LSITHIITDFHQAKAAVKVSRCNIMRYF